MSNRHNYYCNTNLVLLRLGLSEFAQNLHNRCLGRPVIPIPDLSDISRSTEILTSDRGDDPNLRMAFNLL